MGARTPIPFGEAEAKAFNVFKKKYIKHHSNQNEDECTLNATNAWGKLTPQQKMFFAVRPKPIAAYRGKKRGSVPRKKQAGKPKRAVGRAAKPGGKKISRNLTLSQQLKYRKYRKAVQKYS